MKKTSLALLLASLSAASVAQTGAADVKLKRLQDLESCLQAYAPDVAWSPWRLMWPANPGRPIKPVKRRG